MENGRKMAGVVLAAPKSGSGKTFVTCALIQALIEQGVRVRSFKCGPDYIDPMFHRTVLGGSGGNLDTFFTGTEGTRKLFAQAITDPEEFAVVEGVMGLYDGLGGVRLEGSTYDVADAVGLPVLLVVDAHGMARSILAELQGFLDYDVRHRIRGVILNRVSSMFYPTMQSMIEEELGLPVLGYVPEQKEIQFTSRHLGLMMPEELSDIRGKLHRAAEVIAESVDLDQVMAIGRNWSTAEEIPPDPKRQNPPEGKKRILAVARDEAFCFYYVENLSMLEEAGYQLRFFSPIHDKVLPECDALLLGGGYPELYARQLSENYAMRNSIREALEQGLPSIAECGGFMYLHDAIEDTQGQYYPMVGMVSGTCSYQGHLVRFGYVSLREQESHFLPEGEWIRGHEFHYCDSTNNGEDVIAEKPTGSRSWKCVHVGKEHWWGFPHLYYPSNPHFVKYFSRLNHRNIGTRYH